MKKRYKTVKSPDGKEIYLVCPGCGRIGTTDENGNIISITNLYRYIQDLPGQELTLRCNNMDCGNGNPWRGKVKFSQSGDPI